MAQTPLLERNARNGYGQRFYLIGTVEAVEADQFRIGSYLVRHFTEGIEVGMTLGIEAIFSDKEGEDYVFYPEVIREGENILYNGTERTLDNPGPLCPLCGRDAHRGGGGGRWCIPRCWWGMCWPAICCRRPN